MPSHRPPYIGRKYVTNALKTYSAKQFKSLFGFDYQQCPAESQEPYFFKSFNALSYFEDKDTKNVEPYITTNILRCALTLFFAESYLTLSV